MPKKCPICGQIYEVEPGFFYGAMYVSYVFSVVWTAIVGLSTMFIFSDPPIGVYLLNIGFVSIVFLPMNFRLARSFYIHLVSGIKYQGHKMG